MKGNARIKSTLLGYEDHGILTCMIQLEQRGAGQGFGGYRLDSPKGNSEECCRWVKELLKVTGCGKWEDLVGKHVRVEGEEFGIINGIGHITDELWFYPKNK